MGFSTYPAPVTSAPLPPIPGASSVAASGKLTSQSATVTANLNAGTNYLYASNDCQFGINGAMYDVKGGVPLTINLSSAATSISVYNYSDFAKDGFSAYNMPSSSTWGQIAFGSNKFVAVKTDWTGSNQYAYSSDGVSWSAGTFPITIQTSSIIFANDVFIVIGMNTGTSTAYVLRSSDGTNWTATSMGGTLSGATLPSAIAYGNGTFVVSANNGNSFCASYSKDNGASWTAAYGVQSPTGSYGVAFGNGLFYMPSYNSTATSPAAYTSHDGKSWMKQAEYSSFTGSAGSYSSRKCVGFVNGKFVSTASGYVRISDDAILHTDLSLTSATQFTPDGRSFMIAGGKVFGASSTTDGLYYYNGGYDFNTTQVFFTYPISGVGSAFGKYVFTQSTGGTGTTTMYMSNASAPAAPIAFAVYNGPTTSY